MQTYQIEPKSRRKLKGAALLSIVFTLAIGAVRFRSSAPALLDWVGHYLPPARDAEIRWRITQAKSEIAEDEKNLAREEAVAAEYERKLGEWREWAGHEAAINRRAADLLQGYGDQFTVGGLQVTRREVEDDQTRRHAVQSAVLRQIEGMDAQLRSMRADEQSLRIRIAKKQAEVFDLQVRFKILAGREETARVQSNPPASDDPLVESAAARAREALDAKEQEIRAIEIQKQRGGSEIDWAGPVDEQLTDRLRAAGRAGQRVR